MAEAKSATADAENSTEASALDELGGPIDAAILLMALGEQEAAEILRHMEPDELQRLGEAMTALDGVSQQQINGTLHKFFDNIRDETALDLGSRDYLSKTLMRALGREKAGSILSQIRTEEGGPNSLEALKWMHPRSIATILRGEHPQIIALVLLHLRREQAGQVLDMLPEVSRTDIVVRISELDVVHPSALEELDGIIAHLFETNHQPELTGLGGIKAAAEILNGVSSESESRIFEELAELNHDLGDQIQENMFIFENLLSLDDRGMQTLLREVSSDQLVVALKGSNSAMQQKVFKNMSSRAADLLRDDLAAKGPVRLAEVEEAQKAVLNAANRLAEDGVIMLGGKGDDFV